MIFYVAKIGIPKKIAGLIDADKIRGIVSPCIHPICSRLSTAVPPRRDSNLGQIEMITRINADIIAYAVIGYLDNEDNKC